MFLNNLINHWNSPHHGSWRDYFIPHAGNGHKPHSLHPKRLVFHAVSIIAIKAVVVVFAVVFPLSAWMTPDLALEQGRKIIALTNNLRQSLRLSVLKEDQKLNQAAYAKAQDMFLKQYFAHISPSGRGLEYFLGQVNYKFAVAGENLAIGFSTPEEVMAAWKQSPTHYANLIDPDFSQIGVGLTEGKFEGEDTTLIAQYFGAPDSVAFDLAQAPKKVGTKAKPASAEKKTIIPTKNTVNPVVSPEKTNIIVEKTPNKTEQAIKVETYLATSTKTAEAVLGDTKIALQKDQAEPQKWSGTAVAATQDNSAQAPAVITTTDATGQTVVSDISANNIKPRQVTPLEQYFFFKNNPNKTLQTIFDISSLYFKIILLLAIVSLLLNIFIEIKKQHPHLIASGVGLVSLLIILIIF